MKKTLVFLLLMTGQLLGQSVPLRINQITQVVVKFSSITTPYAGVAGITITGITGRVIKHSDTASATSITFTCAASGANTCTEIGGGYYGIMFPASYVDTIGRLTLDVSAANAFSPTWKFSVIAEPDWQVNMLGNMSDNNTVAAAIWALARSAPFAGSYGEALNNINTNVDAPISGVPTALLDLPNGIETSYTLRAWLRLMGAVFLGKANGFNTNTPTYRDPADTKNRVRATTDNTGRLTVTLDPN